MTHLDTSFLIRALVPGSRVDHSLRRWLQSSTPVGISTIAWTEFLCGPVEPADVDLARGILGEPVPFGAAEAERAARLFHTFGRRRANPSDFRRFESAGLRLAIL